MLTPAILGSLRIPATTASSAQAVLGVLTGELLEATLESSLSDGLILRLPDGRQIQAQGSLPFPPGSTLTLKALPLPEGAGTRLQVIRATPPGTPTLLAPLTQGEAAHLLAKLQTPGSESSPLAMLLRNLLLPGNPATGEPASWAAWMKEAMRTLSDPATMPTESAFHRLQAKEGTGLFEIPLPWATGAGNLQLWVEADRDPADPAAEPMHRVLLSIPFTELGEVRVGIESSTAGLRVRVWLEDPQRLEALRPALETELAALGGPVSLRLLPLPEGSPDLRSLAGASPLQAMG